MLETLFGSSRCHQIHQFDSLGVKPSANTLLIHRLLNTSMQSAGCTCITNTSTIGSYLSINQISLANYYPWNQLDRLMFL